MEMISSDRVFLSYILRASCHRCREEHTISGNHATSLDHHSSLKLFPVYSSTDFYHRGCLAISSQQQISPGFYPENQCLSFYFAYPISILGLEWWLRVSAFAVFALGRSPRFLLPPCFFTASCYFVWSGLTGRLFFIGLKPDLTFSPHWQPSLHFGS